MNHAQLEFVRQAATATLWHIEHLMEDGMPFETAKREAIKKAEPGWRAMTRETAQAVRNIAWSLTLSDLSPDARRGHGERFCRTVEELRGKPMAWHERLLFALTGMTW